MPTVSDQIKREDFINAIRSLKLRVEKQPSPEDNLKTFVQIIDFNSLTTPNTQIIYGRNGTGKTHLLKAFCVYSELHFKETKILPIYIDFRELDLGPILSNISLDDLIIRFYRLFLGKIVNALKEFSDKVLTVSFFENVFGSESKSKKQKLQQSIEKIYSLLNLEQIEETVKEYVKKVEIDKEDETRIAGKAGISSKLTLSGFRAGINAGISMSAEEIEKNKETIELIYNGLAVINYSAIRDELETIIELCGADSIFVMLSGVI